MATLSQRLAFHQHRLNPYDGMSARWYKPDSYQLPKVEATATIDANDVRQYLDEYHQATAPIAKYRPEDDAVFCGSCHSFLCHKSEVAFGIGAGFVCPSCGANTRL